MHEAEARWLAARLRQLSTTELSPMLNVGSSTRHFREVKQPWIERDVFAPLARAGCRVVHVDMRLDEGVDIAGNLMEPDFLHRLQSIGARSIFCSNVLEHVTDPSTLADRLQRLVPAGGYLIVTVPHRFPYHPDPIDTLFRPELGELHALFPQTRMIAGDVVDCGSIWDTMSRSWMQLIVRIAWLPFFFIEHRRWVGNLHKLRSLQSRATATCAVLQRL
jgi:hypothetical protein